MPEILSRDHQLKLFRVRPSSLERKPYRRRFEEPKDSVSIRSRRIGSRTAAIHNLTSIRKEKSMSLSLYEITIPVMIAGFGNMSKCLDRGRAYADEKGIAHVKLLNARLADDMMSLVEQVQRASDTAKRAAVRVGLVDNIAMPDHETTFEDLQARISATVSFLATVPPPAFERQADAELIVQLPGGQRVFTGRSYILGFALPNFFFHITTAYDLLRHLGVPIGKRDFLGWR